MATVEELVRKEEFPRSKGYDPEWVLDNQMGPNALWLMEWITRTLELKPGMRVLDLGCGRGMTSVFLAKEFGVRVWATDLWIGPDGNYRRAIEAGVGDLVCPMRVEAHQLPFAAGFFDAALSVDAYQYFGTDALYLGYLAHFVRPGGSIAVALPGLMQPMHEVPAHLAQPQSNGKCFWEDDCACFETADQWQRRWSTSSKVENVQTETLAAGWRHWRDFEEALEISGKGHFPSDAEALEKDAGRYIGFLRVSARRNEAESMNLNDPTLGARFGVDG